MTSLATWEIWLVMVVAGLGTYSLRLSFLALAGRGGGMPLAAQRALRLVPAAVLAALITPAVLRAGGDIDLWNARVAAAALAALVAVRTRNVAATLAVGMAALWLLDAL